MKKQSFVLVAFLLFYCFLQIHLAPFIVLFIFIMQQKRDVVGCFKHRIGFVPKTMPQKPTIWIHAVSVGEVAAIQELTAQIKKRIPDVCCYVTVGTTGGFKTAKQNPHADIVSYIPYDFVPSMLLAYHRIKPKAIIVVESELWPALLMPAKLFKIPLYLINARISPRPRNLLFTFEPIARLFFSCFSSILTQTENDKKRLDTLDLQIQIATTGNIKSLNSLVKKEIVEKKLTKEDFALKEKYQILFVGCMHPGEDTVYLDLFSQLKKQHPHMKLILAPRHFAWQKQLEENVKNKNLSYTLWTDQQQLPQTQNNTLAEKLDTVFEKSDLLLVCKLGELFALYPYTTLYFLGGTFVPVGGHNLLDPLAWKLPTIIGPYHHNSKILVGQLLQTKGVCLVPSEDDLYNTVHELIKNHKQAEQLGESGFTLIEKEARSVQKHFDFLIGQLQEMH